MSHRLHVEEQKLGFTSGLLQAVDDGGAKQSFPLHGNAIKDWPDQVSVEIDLTGRIGLVHSISSRPHSSLHTKLNVEALLFKGVAAACSLVHQGS